MKKVVIDWCLKKVQENKKYTKDELEQIEYGLVSIYLLITKLVVILLICFLLFNQFNITIIIHMNELHE